jgi:hypothetical protein
MRSHCEVDTQRLRGTVQLPLLPLPLCFLTRNPCLTRATRLRMFLRCAGVDEPCNPFIPPPAAVRSKTLMPYVHVMSTYLQRSRLPPHPHPCPPLQVNRDQAFRHFHHRCSSLSGCCVWTFHFLSLLFRSPLPSLSSCLFFACFPPFFHSNEENRMVCPMRHSVWVRPARTGTRVTQKCREWVHAGLLTCTNWETEMAARAQFQIRGRRCSPSAAPASNTRKAAATRRLRCRPQSDTCGKV